MFEAEATEFPFMAQVPKREKSKLARVWDHFKAVSAVVEEKGMLVPQHLAAELLGVSRQRIWVLANEGRLEGIELGGIRYVTEDSVIAFAKLERKAGRPVELPKNNREMWAASMRAAKASRTKDNC